MQHELLGVCDDCLDSAPAKRPPAGGGTARRSSLGHRRSRYDGRFYLVGALVLGAAIAGALLGADGFDAYPTVELGFGPATAALAGVIVLSGLAPLRRQPRRRRV